MEIISNKKKKVLVALIVLTIAIGICVTSNAASNNILKDIDGKLGKYVKFEGHNELWVVLYNDVINGVQLISADTLQPKKIKFGYNDNVMSTFITNNTTDRLARSYYSYKNASNNLNDKCEEIVKSMKLKGVQSIRSVGTNPLSKNDKSKTVKNKGQNIDGRKITISYYKNDTNWLKDFNRLGEIRHYKSDNKYPYWLACTSIDEKDGFISLGMHRVNTKGKDEKLELFAINTNKNPNLIYSKGETYAAGVRPVISIKDSLLRKAKGSGTKNNPLIIKQK